MSSKSRKKTPSPNLATPVVSTGGEATKDTGHDDEHGLLGEDVIHVPKGKNRVQYAVMVALMVFLTIIFLVPGAILNTFLGDGPGDQAYLVFLDPDGKPVEMKRTEFYEEAQSFDRVFGMDGMIPAFGVLRYFLGLPERSIEHEDYARLIVLDRLAREAGILITDQEVAEFLGSIEGLSSDLWVQITRRYDGPAKVEASLKRVLGIRRYLDLVSKVASVPDVGRIEEIWAEEHVELAYDYVALPTEDFLDAAKAEAPDDATLEEWLEGRSDFEKSQFFVPARYRAVIAMMSDPSTATALVERYPDASGDTPEALAEKYYNEVFFTRFPRTDPGEDETPFLPLDDVRDVCEAEAPAYFAAKAWIADMRSRVDAGGELDFSSEAAELGLELTSIDEPSTLDDIREREGLGAFVVGPISQTPPKQVAPRPILDASGIYVVHVTERVEPSLPPFAEIRDQVLEKWAEERSKELALERLAELRDGFEAFAPELEEGEEPAVDEDGNPIEHRRADEAAFRAAAEAAGFEVGRRDWLDRSAPATADPNASEPAHQFFVRHREYAELAEGEVAEPALDSARTTAYLARKVGEQPIDVSKMTPGVYQNYKMRTAGEASNQVRQYLTGEGLDQQYGIDLIGKVAEEDEFDEFDETGSDEEQPAE